MGIPSPLKRQEAEESMGAQGEADTEQAEREEMQEEQTEPEEAQDGQAEERGTGLRVGVEPPVLDLEGLETGTDDLDADENQEQAIAAEKNELRMETVGEDYFADALFIGDSRTVGMEQCGLLPDATYYAKTGIGIGEILETAIIYENGTMLTIPQALQLHDFGKVYIMIGINDMVQGGVDWFLEKYQEILDVVQETQPGAIIYIQGNIPMSYSHQETGTSDGALTNANLRNRNEASRTLADDNTIFYLDIQDIYADSYGNLNTIYTNDGLHVKMEKYDMWVTYLKQHARVWSEESSS